MEHSFSSKFSQNCLVGVSIFNKAVSNLLNIYVFSVELKRLSSSLWNTMPFFQSFLRHFHVNDGVPQATGCRGIPDLMLHAFPYVIETLVSRIAVSRCLEIKLNQSLCDQKCLIFSSSRN